jgi:hypothetical protein
MKKKRSPKAVSRGAKTMTIGRARFTKISAVEGIVLTPRMEKRIADFERADSPQNAGIDYRLSPS